MAVGCCDPGGAGGNSSRPDDCDPSQIDLSGMQQDVAEGCASERTVQPDPGVLACRIFFRWNPNHLQIRTPASQGCVRYPEIEKRLLARRDKTRFGTTSRRPPTGALKCGSSVVNVVRRPIATVLLLVGRKEPVPAVRRSERRINREDDQPLVNPHAGRCPAHLVQWWSTPSPCRFAYGRKTVCPPSLPYRLV